MSIRSLVLDILEEEGLGANLLVGEQTAYEVVEAAVLGALEQISEVIDS